MKALASFTVRPRLPESLAPLKELALNVRWSWNDTTQDLFQAIDPEAWSRAGHDPVRMLGLIDRNRLIALAEDPEFLSELTEVHQSLRRELEADLWFQRRSSPVTRVAYFSPEFGLAAALPQYSGGLGVLAGDHLKAAGGSGVPVVGVGLFYDHGYFRQELDADGWQQERYASLDPHSMALTATNCPLVEVDLAGTRLVAKVWRVEVGRIPLYLLDTDVAENDLEARRVTDRLYGGDIEHRLRQEILLGIGGVRALDAAGETAQVFHSNEGHAGFLGFERVRRLIVAEGLTFNEAVEAVRAGTVFTTHTPVPAGIDRFPRPLMERYFKTWAGECDIDFDTVMALGHEPGEPADAPFNMAIMGMRLAGTSNGVSKLHGMVSRRIFHGLWPNIPEEERPITSITNGVHARTWTSKEMSDLFTRHLGGRWQEAEPERWAAIDSIPDGELWDLRDRARQQLVAFVRNHLRNPARLARSPYRGAEQVLDPGVLTIGFARRFASYKRATLLLSQPERLTALLLDERRPIQLVFSGKAHPADDAGKEMIRQVVQFSRRPELQHRIAFLEDYDIEVARTLYQGCDVWLNNPRRPLEACGTSGEKAALNGVLNFSVLDGWWDELYNGENGWAIYSAENYDDLQRRDHLEASSLFDVLEHDIVPLFYDRPDGRVPSGWVRRIKASLRSLVPVVTASRMVREYVERLYEPAAERDQSLRADGYQRARALAAWKARVQASWHEVRIEKAGSDTSPADLEQARLVTADVHLGNLTPGDVQVQVLHGVVGTTDELLEPGVVAMAVTGSSDGGVHHFEASVAPQRAGHYGFTVRVVPAHPDLRSYAELGLVAWA